MTFTLPELAFDPSKLAGFCSAETFQYHHGKHHATYVSKLNDAIKGTAYEILDLEIIIKKSYQENNKAVYNNAAQHFNHSFFWNCLTTGSGAPGPQLSALINREFGSLEKFRELFTTAAASLFGSGWVWLAIDKAGKLEILSLKDADSPIITEKTPLLTLDIWEHAYYIDHRNARPQYINAFWNFVNWNFAETKLPTN